MTNPFKQFEQEYIEHDYMMPSAQQITATDPGTIKTMMEVYRDTANHLDATEVKLAQEMARYEELQHDCRHEKDVSEELRSRLKHLDEMKTIAEKTLEFVKSQRDDTSKQFDNLRQHRDELADRVQKARKAHYGLKDWLSEDDASDDPANPYEVLQRLEEQLEDALGAEPAQEEED